MTSFQDSSNVTAASSSTILAKRGSKLAGKLAAKPTVIESDDIEDLVLAYIEDGDSDQHEVVVPVVPVAVEQNQNEDRFPMKRSSSQAKTKKVKKKFSPFDFLAPTSADIPDDAFCNMPSEDELLGDVDPDGDGQTVIVTSDVKPEVQTGLKSALKANRAKKDVVPVVEEIKPVEPVVEPAIEVTQVESSDNNASEIICDGQGVIEDRFHMELPSDDIDEDAQNDTVFKNNGHEVEVLQVKIADDTSTPVLLAEVVKTEKKSAKSSANEKPALFFAGVPDKNKKIFGDSQKKGVSNNIFVWLKKNVQMNDNGKTKYLNIHYVDSTDTEFRTPESPLAQQSREGLCSQFKGIDKTAPKKIFLHPKHAKKMNAARVRDGLKPLPVIKSVDAHFVDYLVACGAPASIQPVQVIEDLDKLPIFTYTMNSHFSVAELLMVFGGNLKKEIKDWIRKKLIIMRRRLVIVNPINPEKSEDWLQFTSCVIEIEGIRYALRLRLIDTCAMHGVASYADIAANVGWELKDKDKLSKKDKAKMLDIALTRPADFEAYALGDLDVYDILAMYDVKWREVYKILGMEEYYREPALTIGASVRDLFCAKLAKYFDIGSFDEKGNFSWRNEFDEKVKPFLDFNATEIRSWVKSSAVLLCKVEGGRCRNNRPKSTFIKRKTTNGYDATYDQNIIIDIDISGCYGEGQRNQLFFLGHPSVMELDLKQDKARYNKYPAIRGMINSLGVKVDVLVKAAKEKNLEVWQDPDNWGELIAGGWIMRTSTSESLKYGQDFFASWFTNSGYKTNIMAKFIKDNLSTDSEVVDNVETVDFDEKYGATKIFENEIHNGILTHDGLQFILGVASDRQRNELLDKLCVISGSYYPRSMEIHPRSLDTAIDELGAEYDGWEGTNTFSITDAKTGATQQNYNSCHAWIGINLGDLIVDKLLIERKRAQIKFGKKSPLDQLFKLCVNTLYGDMVSPYFIISNPIVGNNITARARALAWYMEKGFNGFESITDGCGFQANKVLFSGRDTINGELTGSVRDKKITTKMIGKRALDDVDEILMNDKGELFTRVGDVLTSIGEGGDNSFLNEKAMEHLQNLFPCVDVLHAKTTQLTVDKKTCEAIYTPRIGQFSFETKDAYVAGAFHGSANYIFMKSDGTLLVKMRGYETNKIHEAWEFGKDNTEDFKEDFDTYVKTDRYGDDNNPGKDFMHQLLNNPTKIKRQQTAIKEGIFKIGEYAENWEKFDKLGIEPGDSIKRKMLMQEFSLSQFTFKTYEQYRSWEKIVNTDKENNKQSIETFFLDTDGDLNFVEMVKWVADAIERGVLNPYEELDKNRHKARDKNPHHPCLQEYITIGDKLNGWDEPDTDKTVKTTNNTTVEVKKTSETKSVKKIDKKTQRFEHLEPE